jgi:release factor glutamine methyltransferase
VTQAEASGALAPLASTGRETLKAHTPQMRRSLAEALRSAERHLTASGVASPRVDAEFLAAHLLRSERMMLWRHMHDPVPDGFDDLVARRAERIPLQHLTGVAYFRTISLAVGPGVFSPRPETELVAGVAIDLLIDASSMTKGWCNVVDLCAGSGAIAASVVSEVARVNVHAVERDPAAAPWLQHNARQHGFTAHIADIAHCLPDLNGLVDVVTANPPYIPDGCVPRDPEVARFDPPAALYSGTDGLDHIRLVEQTACRLLRPGGSVVVEHGDLQGRAAPEVFESSDAWVDVVDHVDLTGRDRYLTAVRAGV